MATSDLKFDVSALDRASSTFTRLGQAVERFERKLDQLDGKRVNATVDVDTRKAETQLVKLDKSLGDSVIHVAALSKAFKTIAVPAGIAAAAPQLLSLGSAAVSASGSLALLPAVAAAGGAAFGALKVGLTGFGEAMKFLKAGNLEAFAGAVDRLSPAAETAAIAIKDLGESWTAMRESVQERLFTGVAEEIRALGATYIPVLDTGLGRVTAGFNAAAVGVSQFLREANTVADVRTILDGTGAAVEALAPAVTNVVAAFTDLAAVGSQFLPGLAGGLTNATARFREFIAQARETGQIRAWIQDGIDTLAQLGRIAGNVGKIIGGLFSAADLSGVDTLDKLERATRGMAEALNSIEGQGRAATLLREIAETFMAIWDAGEPIHRLLGELALDVLPPLLQVVQLLAPALVPIAQGLLLIKLAATALSALRAVPQWFGDVQVQATGASTVLRQLRDEMRLQQALAESAGQSIGSLGAAFAVAQSRAGRFLQDARDASSEFHNLSRSATALGERLQTSIPQAAERAGQALQGALVGGVERVARTFEAVGSGIARFGSAFGRAGQAAASGVGRVTDAVKSLPSILSRAVDRAGDALLSGVAAWGRGLDKVGSGIVDGLAASFRGLSTVGEKAVDGLTTGFRGLSTVGEKAVDGLAAAFRGLTTAGERAVDGLAAGFRAATTAGNAMVNGLTTGFRGLSSAGELMTSGLQAGLRGLSTAGDAVVTGFQRLRDVPAAVASGLQSGFTAAANAASTAANGIATAASNAGTALRNIGTSISSFDLPGAFARMGQAAGNFGNTLASGLSRGLAAMGTFSSAVGALGSTLGSGLMRAGSSLVSFLGGPWGVAFAAASVALGVFAGKQAEAAQKTAEAKQALEQQRQSLDQVSGAVTQATVQQKALELAQSGLLDKADALKVSTQDYTQASLGNADALKRVQAQIESQVQAVIAASPAYKSSSLEIQNMGLSLADLSAAAQGSPAALAKVDEAVRRASGGSLEAQSHLRMVADALIAAGGPAADLGRQLLEANGGLEQNVRQTQQAAEAAGRLQQQMQGVAQAFAAVPGTKTITVEASSISGVRAELEQMGFQIVNLPDGQVKITAPTDAALANLFALKTTIDSTTGTVIIDGNVDPATGKVQQTIQLADGSIGTITVDARPDPATGKIQGTVALADGSTGTITIDGRPDPATGKINATVTYANGQTGIVKIDADTSAATSKLRAFLAQSPTITVGVKLSGPAQGVAAVRAAGAYTTPAAAYALGGLRPMSARWAEIVPPNQPRIIGDRQIGDEAFIPINTSPRSQQILATAAQRMGFALSPAAAAMRTGVPAAQPVRGAAGPTSSAAVVAAIRGLDARFVALQGELGGIRDAVASARPINVNGTGDPVETARATQLALRIA